MTGQITKISTTADQCVRLTVDIDKDMAPDDIFRWLHESVVLTPLRQKMEVTNANR